MTATYQALNEALGDSSRRKMLGLLAADRLMGMGFAARSHLLAERLARKTVNGTIGQETVEPEDEALKTMNISVGDTVNIIPETPAPAPAPVITPPPNPIPAVEAATKKIWPYVLSAALGAGGLGAGGIALLDSLTKPETPIVQPAENEQYEVRISSGAKK